MNVGLGTTQQHALTAQKAKRVLDCTQSSVGNRVREGILPLCFALVGPPPTPPAMLQRALGSSAQERHGPIGVGPQQATKIIRGIKHHS